ncbi:MAG: TFIIB-type zinc ribbon-containing protein [Promethearchaeota archaeon]
MVCPNCGTKLEKAIFHNVEIDYCPNCLGIWFDQDELRLAKDSEDEDLKWLDIDLWEDETKFKLSPVTKLCPRCRLPLYEVEYADSGIKVDVCNICHGIWLDRGEFKKIINYLEEKGKKEMLTDYTHSLAKEFWEIFTGPERFRSELTDFLILLKLFVYKFEAKHPKISKIILNLPR